MTDTEELRAILAKATPGEWLYDPNDPYMGEYEGWIFSGPIGIVEAQNSVNAAAIVALHNAAPAMLDEIDALRAENARLRLALTPLAKRADDADAEEARLAGLAGLSPNSIGRSVALKELYAARAALTQATSHE
jgi:hypothetical protein